MAEPSKKEKIRHIIQELKEMITLLERHFEELEKEIEDNNERPK